MYSLYIYCIILLRLLTFAKTYICMYATDESTGLLFYVFLDVSSFLFPRCAGLNTSADTLIAFLPFFHAYGLYLVSYYVHTLGARLVVMPKFEPNSYLHLIEKYKVR